MEIIPAIGKVFVKPDKTDLGAFEQVDSRVSESGTVTHVGEMVASLQVGDKIYFKAWGADSVEINGEMYFVMDIDRRNILCKVKEQ